MRRSCLALFHKSFRSLPFFVTEEAFAIAAASKKGQTKDFGWSLPSILGHFCLSTDVEKYLHIPFCCPFSAFHIIWGSLLEVLSALRLRPRALSGQSLCTLDELHGSTKARKV